MESSPTRKTKKLFELSCKGLTPLFFYKVDRGRSILGLSDATHIQRVDRYTNLLLFETLSNPMVR